MTITAGGTNITPTTAERRPGWRFGLLAALFVASIALPFIFLGEGPSWFHLVFHLLGVALCTVAVLTLRSIRRHAASKTLRVLTWISTVAFLAWFVGHAGELATVVTHGGAHADQTLFENPVHVFFATIAVPAWMTSVLSSLVLLITAGVQAIIRKVKR